MENENDSSKQDQPLEVEIKARTADIQVAEEFNFSKFMLSDQLLRSLTRMNFIKPSPIQLKVIPLAKCGLDLILQAKSGTGKTLAFAICLLETYDGSLQFPQSLVIVPTREIAVQIVGVLNELGKNIRNFKACEFIGGTEFANDRKTIQTSKVVVGTPGRILHLIRNEVFNISNLKTLVLDEADKLLEGGHIGKDVKEILNLMNSKIQIIASTATVTNHLENFLKQAMNNPIGITPKHEIPVLLGIKQFVKVFPKENSVIALMNQKIEELNRIFKRIPFKQCVLFTDSQSKTESYGIYLKKLGWKSQVINAGLEQSERLKVLDSLVNFKCRILIATDLMARGIDIENINLVVNLDLPFDCFTYLHRIGRAGRFGSHGVAITFINGEDDVMKFQKMLGDIGGERLKAMMYPEESVQYDFWDFDQQSEENLETVAGVSMNDTHEDCAGDQKDIVMNNIALMEVTRKIVDDNSNAPAPKFDLKAMLNDYKQVSGEAQAFKKTQPDGEPKPSNGHSNGKDENIFLKVIDDLKLYDDKNDEIPDESHAAPPKFDFKAMLNNYKQVSSGAVKPSNGHISSNSDDDSDGEIPGDDVENRESSQKNVEQPAPKEVRKVIFKRPVIEDDEPKLSSSDSESEEDIEGTDDEEQNYESGSEDEPVVTKQIPMEEPTHRQHQEASVEVNPYSQYVASHYLRWSHMYQFQLAGIQSYVESARK